MEHEHSILNCKMKPSSRSQWMTLPLHCKRLFPFNSLYWTTKPCLVMLLQHNALPMTRDSKHDRTFHKMRTSKVVLRCALRSAKNDMFNPFVIHFKKCSNFQSNPSINFHILFTLSEQSLEASQDQQGEFNSPFQLERIHSRDSYHQLAKCRGPDCHMSWSQSR